MKIIGRSVVVAKLVAFLVLSLPQLLLAPSHGLEIRNIEEFIIFTRDVNKGTSYNGSTVFLEADFDMEQYSSSFEPIGKSFNEHNFRGTFEEHGHTISNLKFSSDKFIFLLSIFGYSRGAMVKNLAVDGSCSFESKYSNSDNCSTSCVFERYNSYDDNCIIEGCVNMGHIKYIGADMSCSYVGGVAGVFTPTSNKISISNCVNYGSISSTGSLIQR